LLAELPLGFFIFVEQVLLDVPESFLKFDHLSLADLLLNARVVRLFAPAFVEFADFSQSVLCADLLFLDPVLQALDSVDV